MKNPAKKILCTVMALLVVGTSGVVFTGCGSDNSKDSSSSKVETKAETTAEETRPTDYRGEEYGDIDWPTQGLATKLPEPSSTIGEISRDSYDEFDVTVASVTKDDFKDYVKACKEKGFIVNYDGTDDSYEAKNNDGYSLRVYYYDYDESYTMDITIEPPKGQKATISTKPKTTKPKATKPKATKPKATKKTTSQKSNSTSGVNADFKATMDSYEEFFNDYVDFMKKYKNSTDITSMASDYADYMTKYSDMMQKLNDIKSEDLSTADLAYYNEVNARITKKLAEVAN